jgi:hypothetical protein
MGHLHFPAFRFFITGFFLFCLPPLLFREFLGLCSLFCVLCEDFDALLCFTARCASVVVAAAAAGAGAGAGDDIDAGTGAGRAGADSSAAFGAVVFVVGESTVFTSCRFG